MQYILTMHCENMHWPRTARKLLSAGNTPVIPQALTLSIDPTFRSKFGCDHQMRIAPAHLHQNWSKAIESATTEKFKTQLKKRQM